MKTIQNTLRALGITKCYKGLSHVEYAIYLSIEKDERLEAVTKEIYMETATYFGCKWTAVERNIRTVVLRAWQINPSLLCEMAGYPLTAAPTASEFIEMVSFYIRNTSSPKG